MGQAYRSSQDTVIRCRNGSRSKRRGGDRLDAERWRGDSADTELAKNQSCNDTTYTVAVVVLVAVEVTICLVAMYVRSGPYAISLALLPKPHLFQFRSDVLVD